MINSAYYQLINTSMSINVSLPRELEEFVDKRVESGRYTSASEVVREGLRLLGEQERLKTMRADELEGKLLIGVDQLDRKKAVSAAKAFEQLRRRSLQVRRQKHA